MQKCGVIADGQYAGWIVEIRSDENTTGGFYLLAHSPDDVKVGWDQWYETEGDLMAAIAEQGITVAWRNE